MNAQKLVYIRCKGHKSGDPGLKCQSSCGCRHVCPVSKNAAVVVELHVDAVSPPAGGPGAVNREEGGDDDSGNGSVAELNIAANPG